MALRSPRSWNEAADLLSSVFGQESMPGGATLGLQEILDAITKRSGGNTTITGPITESTTIDRSAKPGRVVERAAGADRVGGRARPGGRGMSPSVSGRSLMGGGARTNVPEGIRRGNPNIERAQNFDLSETNPHAAGLLASDAGRPARQAMRDARGGGRDPESIIAAFRASREGRSGSPAMTASGSGPGGTAEDLVRGIRERGRTRTETAPDPETLATSLTGRARADLPDADTLVAAVRSRLGGAGASAPSAAQTAMREIMTSLGQGRGLGATPDADALVAAIRAQATPSGGALSGQMMPGTRTDLPPGNQAALAAATGTRPTLGQPPVFTANLGTPDPGSTSAPPITPGGGYANRAAVESAMAQTPYQPGGMAPQNVVTAPSGGGVGAPQGAIPMDLQIAYGRGGDWATVNQWDQTLTAEAAKHGVPPEVLKAIMVVETGGQHIPGVLADGSAAPWGGLMQIHSQWAGEAAAAGYDISTPEGQIGWAAKMLGDEMKRNGGDWEAAFRSVYYPMADPNATSPSGHTQNQYVQDIHTIIGLLGSAGGTTPAAAPGTAGPAAIGSNAPQGGSAIPGSGVYIPNGGPIPQQAAPGAFDPSVAFPGSNAPIATGGSPANAPVIAGPGGVGGAVPVDAGFDATIVQNSKYPGPPNNEPRAVWSPESMAYLEGMASGAAQAAVDNGYGFKDDGPASYCNYAGWNCNKHSGLDIPMADESPVNSLVSGQVVCLGGASSASNPGVGCGAYSDDGGGIGQVSVMQDDGSVVVYGHLSGSQVGLDAQVQAGQPLAQSGVNVGPHVHMDVLLPIGPGGEYILVDPNLYFTGHYCGAGFCPS